MTKTKTRISHKRRRTMKGGDISSWFSSFFTKAPVNGQPPSDSTNKAPVLNTDQPPDVKIDDQSALNSDKKQDLLSGQGGGKRRRKSRKSSKK